MDIKYTVRYSQRKSIGIKINPDSSVVVTAPYDTSHEAIESAVERHREWIRSHIGRAAGTDGGFGEKNGGCADFCKRQVVCKGREIPYTVVYSDRRSISVKINYDMSVAVRAPHGTPEERIAEFMDKRSDWIASHIGHIESERDRFADVVEYRKILLSGKEYELCRAARTCLAGDALYLRSWSALKPFVVGEFGKELTDTTRELAKKLGLNLKEVRFRSYKARWGCCDSCGVVSFNYKLLMIPKDLQLYVAVHELCHLVEMNHSARFWKAVETVMPDYRERHEKSHEYDFLLRLYP